MCPCGAFVGVYLPPFDKRVPKWRVRRLAIPEHLVDQYFGEEDLVDSEFIRLDSLEEVEDFVSRWGIDSSTLDAPWKSDYPL